MKPGNAVLDLKGALILILFCASWGFNQVAIKAAIPVIPPVLQAGIRSVGACILVLLWMRFRRIPVFARDGTLWWGVGAGLLFSFEFILIYWGLEYTNASRAVIFIYTSPFVVALGAWLFLPGEALGKLQAGGLLLAFLGIVIAFHESFGLPASGMFIGDVMLLLAAIFWGATTVVIKAGPLAFIHPVRILLYQLAVSAMLLPPASLLLGEKGISALPPMALASLFYQVVWIAFITYTGWFWLIKHYAVSRLSAFTFLTPFFGVLSGAVFLGEPVSARLLSALLLVGTGIYLVNRR